MFLEAVFVFWLKGCRLYGAFISLFPAHPRVFPLTWKRPCSLWNHCLGVGRQVHRWGFCTSDFNGEKDMEVRRSQAASVTLPLPFVSKQLLSLERCAELKGQRANCLILMSQHCWAQGRKPRDPVGWMTPGKVSSPAHQLCPEESARQLRSPAPERPSRPVIPSGARMPRRKYRKAFFTYVSALEAVSRILPEWIPRGLWGTPGRCQLEHWGLGKSGPCFFLLQEALFERIF